MHVNRSSLGKILSFFEVRVFLFFPSISGGGFSDIFAIPEYQKEDVTKFLKKFPPPFTSTQFNNSGKVNNCFALIFMFVLRNQLGVESWIPRFERKWVRFYIWSFILRWFISFSKQPLRANYVVAVSVSAGSSVLLV